MIKRILVLVLSLALLIAAPTQAALTGWSSANYLLRNSPVWPGALGFYVSAWAYRATGSATYGWIYTLIVADTSHRSLYAQNNDTIKNELSAIASATVTGAHANAAWFHVGAYYASARQKAYRDAATPAATSASDTNPSPTITKIGAFNYAGNPLPWANAGALAEVSVWDTSGMSEANVDALDAKLYNGGAGGAGANPLNVNAEVGQPWTGKLVAYVLNSANSLTDLAGNGHNFTQQGTLTNFASHPTIDAVSSGGQARRTQQQMRMRRMA